jgi:hypothetical protein
MVPSVPVAITNQCVINWLLTGHVLLPVLAMNWINVMLIRFIINVLKDLMCEYYVRFNVEFNMNSIINV